jgi:hypothetical protein
MVKKATASRRQIRRKFEALERLLQSGDGAVVPPPEYLLTQPPPVSGSS